MLRKLFILGLVVVLLYVMFINDTTSRIIFSNRSVIAKVLSLSEYALVSLVKLLWHFLCYLVELVCDLWYSASGRWSPPEDIRSNEELYQLYRQVEAWSQIPWQIFWGIHEEETRLGRNLGTTKVINILSDDQKVYLLQMCRELHWDPHQVYGSHKGAIGPFQFIPETWVRNAVDADGDGRKDPFNTEDAAYSAANYLLRHGGAANLRDAIWHYNQDSAYVRRVMRYLRYKN